MSVQPRISDPEGASTPECDALVPAAESLMARLVDRMGEGLAVQMCREHLASGGKRHRARLALASVAALDGDVARAVPWAGACELMHNASLVHDDLQDGDRYRRGVKALWATYGDAQAINAGDLLLMLPTLALEELQVDGDVRWRLAAMLARHGAQTAVGQGEEMRLREEQIVSLDRYHAAARGKTAGLFGLPVEGAAVLAGRSREEARRLARPFEDLGWVYQLVDDVVDLYGDKGRGARGADLREGKVSVLVATHLVEHPEDGDWLLKTLRTPRNRTSDADVDRAISRFREAGTLSRVLGEIDARVREVRLADWRDDEALSKVASDLLDRFVEPLEAARG